MKLGFFIAGMLLAMCAVGTYALLSGATVLMALVYAIITAFIAQVMYLITIVVIAQFGKPDQSDAPNNTPNTTFTQKQQNDHSI